MRLLIHSLSRPSWNMAVDEGLLRECREPVLRFYGWSAFAVSIGYFQCCSVVPNGRVFVRRYTGGGLVEHGADVTYSIVAPRGHEFYQMGAARSYEAVHRVIAEGLKDYCGAAVELAGDNVKGSGNACFQKPVQFDVMLNGRKVAGAAQRRTREGCLHQGSIFFEESWIPAFAGMTTPSCLGGNDDKSRFLQSKKIVEVLAPRLCGFLRGEDARQSCVARVTKIATLPTVARNDDGTRQSVASLSGMTPAEEERAAQLERGRYRTREWNEAK